MSLRTFHLFFISVSVLMCLSSGVLIALVAGDELWALPGIILSGAASVGLVLYGRRFLKRYGDILPRT